jgi:hypothetical protein
MAQPLSPAELERIHSLGEFEPLARERMDPVGFDYVAGGSWEETSLRFRLSPRIWTSTVHRTEERCDGTRKPWRILSMSSRNARQIDLRYRHFTSRFVEHQS